MAKFRGNRRNFTKPVKNLCDPAMLYLILSVMGLILLGTQNTSGSSGAYCMGKYECDKVNKPTAFAFQLFYILFWTWLLNFLCKKGYSRVSWIIVLFPFLIYFGAIMALIANGVFVRR